MSTIRRARGLAAALFFSIAGTSCRGSDAPSGPGRLAPTRAALAISSVVPESSGEPVIPLRSARVRLFRLPGTVPELAALDTMVPFRESDPDLALTVGIVVTMASERFGLELTLLDDRQQVAYRARDTVVAYTSGQAPPSAPIVLRYVGADTAVARIALATDESVLPVGEATPLRASAFRRDGSSIPARFGFAVHGTSAITIDGAGMLRASAPVAPGSAWIVARVATGLADSIPAEAEVAASSISLSATRARVDVGDRVTLGAIARDAAGNELQRRRPLWSTSDASVATVTDGVVTGLARGSATITARSGRASADVAISVGPAKVASVLPSELALRVVRGRSAGVSVQVRDEDGVVLAGRAVTWSIDKGAIASVTPSADGAAVVRGLAVGNATLVADVEGVRASIAVTVTHAPAARVVIAPDALSLVQGDVFALGATVFDAAGDPQPGRVVGWRSLDPSSVSVDGAGVVHALGGGRASIIATVDAVADTISVLSRQPTTLTITRTGTRSDSRGTIAEFLASAFDQFGALIDNPVAQWSVTPGATLLSATGPRVELLLPENARAVLSARARGLTADLPVSAAAGTPPSTPAISQPAASASRPATPEHE